MLKRSLRCLAAAAILAAFSPSVLAFQESTVGGAAGKPAVSAPGGAPSLDLALPDVSAGKGKGTEIRIPGVGTLGVLPKLDLGLELLYGSDSAGRPPGVPSDKPDAADGMQLRATIKHRF